MRVQGGPGGSWMVPECMEDPEGFWEGLQCFRGSGRVQEGLAGFGRVREGPGGSQKFREGLAGSWKVKKLLGSSWRAQ